MVARFSFNRGSPRLNQAAVRLLTNFLDGVKRQSRVLTTKTKQDWNMAIKVIVQLREVKLGKNPGKKFVMRPDLYVPIAEKKVFQEAATHSGISPVSMRTVTCWSAWLRETAGILRITRTAVPIVATGLRPVVVAMMTTTMMRRQWLIPIPITPVMGIKSRRRFLDYARNDNYRKEVKYDEEGDG